MIKTILKKKINDLLLPFNVKILEYLEMEPFSKTLYFSPWEGKFSFIFASAPSKFERKIELQF